ncbi:hypothetical protein [Desulfonatronum sp. SC1]|uniref:hypothetical protein n=1 Tax=Desulfonatronum sp. SC1 TaxID=2109626 RepID=UPI00130489CE|nr:hypothetical protein [Desulfonatronum sp. SC1]
MSFRSLRAYFFVFATLLLISCGGGSTVTAVSLTADSNEVAVGGRTLITAQAANSITENPMGEKVTFTIRHNESGSRLDIINDRLDAGTGNENPKAQALFFAGPREGTDIIEASFESGARATTTIKVGEGVVLGNIRLEAFSLGGADSQSTGWRIRATVTDTRGFPAVDVTVSFSTNNGELDIKDTGKGVGKTNDAGIAEALLTGLQSDRGARVWATAGGITVSIDVGPRN